MRLSVIVASYDAPQALERCLAALAAQDCEILVSDASENDSRPALEKRFPAVQWLRGSPAMTLPELYWRTLDRTSCDIVGLLEARAIPEPSWAEAMLRAHAADAEAAAVGGPLAPAGDAGRSAYAYYIAEFARFAPPQKNGRCDALCDANISYKRAFLERHRDRLQAGVWPGELNQQAAASLRMAADGAVEYVCPDRLSLSAGQRFRHGRGYAAARVGGRSPAAKLAHAMFTPALPLLLPARQWRDARRAGLSGAFWRSLPQTLLLDAAWSAGEFLGYAAGPAPRSGSR